LKDRTKVGKKDETFEKCSILFKFEEEEDFNHPDEKHIGTGIQTFSILRIKI